MQNNMNKEMWIGFNYEAWDSEPAKAYKPVKFIRADTVQPLIDALRFYSCQDGYDCPDYGCGADDCILKDEGKRARKALEGFEK